MDSQSSPAQQLELDMELEQQLTINPYNQQLYFPLLGYYQDCCDNEEDGDGDGDGDGEGEEEGKQKQNQNQNQNQKNYQQKLEDLRVQFVLYCNPPIEFWLSWLTDVVIAANVDDSFVSKIEELFKVIMRQAPHDAIVTEYLDAMQSLHEKEVISSEEMRQSFENAVSIVGGDVLLGNTVWSRYRSFEIDETLDAIELNIDGSSAVILEAKVRLISVFRRNLALPLIGNDAVLRELDSVLGEICTESDEGLVDPEGLSKEFVASVEMKETRLTFEENISASEETMSSRSLSAWQAYIDFEIKDKNYLRARRLYERALMASVLWIPFDNDDVKNSQHDAISFVEDYMHFAANVLKDFTILESISTRAIKFHPCWTSINVWRIHFLAMETVGSYDRPFDLAPWLSKVPSLGISNNSTNENGVIGPAVPRRFLATSDVVDSDPVNSEKPADADRSSISNALATLQRSMQCCRFQQDSSYNYISLMMMYCDVYKHQLVSLLAKDAATSGGIAKCIEELRSSFLITTEYMTGYFDTWAEGWLAYVSYKAKIEDSVIEDAIAVLDDEDGSNIESTALEDYEKLIQKFCVDESSSIRCITIWLHYLTFLTEESGTRDVTFIRKVYKRAISLCTTTIMQSQSNSNLHSSFLSYGVNASPGDLLYSHWQAFEAKHGVAKDVLNVLGRYRKYSLKLTAAVAVGEKRGVEKQDKKAPPLNKKRVVDKAVANSNSKSTSEPVSKRVKIVDNKIDSATTVKETIKPSKNTECVAMEVDAAENLSEQDAIVPGKYSVFVKNIDFAVTQRDLENVFKTNKYSSGTTTGTNSTSLVVRLTTSTSGKSRGMAHIDFPTLEARDQAMFLHNTVLKGRPITVEKYVPSAYATADFHPTTVFIKNMSRNTSELEIKSFIREVILGDGDESGLDGDIYLAVKIMKCKRSGNSKGQALVQFKTADLVKKCIDAVTKTEKLLDGNKIIATQSKFPAVVETASTSNSQQAGTTTKPASKSVSSSFKPRRLAMKPTSVVKSKTPSTISPATATTTPVNRSGGESSNDSVKAPASGSVENGSAASKSNSDFRKFFN